jgi:mRNA interferase YafQ
MKDVRRSGQFRKDLRLAQRRGRDLAKLADILDILMASRSLPAACRDHPLKGDWRGCLDCHIEPDWLLIYRVTEDEIELVRTGTHADLFG